MKLRSCIIGKKKMGKGRCDGKVLMRVRRVRSIISDLLVSLNKWTCSYKKVTVGASTRH